MARTLLDYCINEPAKPLPKAGAKAEAAPPAEAAKPLETKSKRQSRVFPPVAPVNLPPSYFVSATYDGKLKKAVIKLYEPESGQIYFWYDNTGHKPYCLTNLPVAELEKIDRLVKHEGFNHIEPCKKTDPFLDHEIEVSKIVTDDPLAIGGKPYGTIRDIIPQDYPKVSDMPVAREDIKVWEANIKYYQSYIYDRQFLPGMIYESKDGVLVEKVVEESAQNLSLIRGLFKDCSGEEQSYAEMWAKLLEYPAPKFRRAAIDIEVLSSIASRIPNPDEAEGQVIAVSVYSSDGEKRVLVLKREGMVEGIHRLKEDVTVEYIEREEELLRKSFEVLWDYPFILTFNGDDFDLRYLSNRALKLGLKPSEIPIQVLDRVCLLKYGIHIDLYKFFFNRSIQIYAYGGRYKDVSLDDVANALLGEKKIHL